MLGHGLSAASCVQFAACMFLLACCACCCWPCPSLGCLCCCAVLCCCRCCCARRLPITAADCAVAADYGSRYTRCSAVAVACLLFSGREWDAAVCLVPHCFCCWAGCPSLRHACVQTCWMTARFSMRFPHNNCCHDDSYHCWLLHGSLQFLTVAWWAGWAYMHKCDS